MDADFESTIMGIINGTDPDFENITNGTTTDEMRDIYHIAFLLRQKLVPDLISTILYHAGIFVERGYWTDRRKLELDVQEDEAPATCLRTPPIRSSVRLQNPVRKVVFQIRSHDQGWASDRNAGSWTWFTAGIVKKNNGNDESLSQEDTQNDRVVDYERELVRNEVGNCEIKVHKVEWSLDSDSEEDRRWISALENGDRIVVRAWARYSGWVNQVFGASVAIYTAAVI